MINLKDLICDNNYINFLDNLLYNLQSLSCRNNKCDISLNNLPPNLVRLDCMQNNITNLDNLHTFTKLEDLNCIRNNLEHLDNLPPNLKILMCEDNKLISLQNLP